VLCSVVTPNSFEAELLTGQDVRDDASALAACDALHDMGPHTVVRRVTAFQSNFLLNRKLEI